VAESQGLELVDVQLVGRGRSTSVRIVIDSEHGVSLEDCGSLSRAVSDELDKAELFDQSFNLEVSSPGADAPFRNLAGYRRNVGKKVEVVLTEPLGKASCLRGILEEAREDGIVLRLETGESTALRFEQIKRASRTLAF
jgi:ribosome maturation factor RimP